MSVRHRLEDAIFLWRNGRQEGAWIQVLIAAAATSRMRFKGKKGGEAFRAFIREVTPTIFDANAPAVPGGVSRIFYNQFRGDGAALDDLIYAHLRCNLVHEAVLAEEVTLCESRVVDDKLVAELQGVGTKNLPLTIPDFLGASSWESGSRGSRECRGLRGAVRVTGLVSSRD